MFISNKLSFQDLAQLALGSPNLGELNIGVLHGLINAVLRKLDCADEKVIVSGAACLHLKTLLRESKPPPLPIYDEGTIKIPQNLDMQLEIMEKNIEKLEIKVNALTKPTFEQNCMLYYTKDPLIKGITNSDHFLVSITNILAKQFMEPLKKLNQKINELEEIWKTNMTCENNCWKNIMKDIESCHSSLLRVHETHEENESTVLKTIAELQQIMDIKASKYEISIIKRAILSEFDHIDLKVRKQAKEKVDNIQPLVFLTNLGSKRKDEMVNETPKKYDCECSEGPGEFIESKYSNASFLSSINKKPSFPKRQTVRI